MRKHRMYGEFTYHTHRLVYLFECARCHKQYAGQTINSLLQRAGRHLRVISEKGCMKLQLHFKRDSHTPRNVRFQTLAKISDALMPSEAETQLKSRAMWIKLQRRMQPVGLNYILLVGRCSEREVGREEGRGGEGLEGGGGGEGGRQALAGRDIGTTWIQ